MARRYAPIAPRPLAQSGERRFDDAPVTIETAGDADELLVLSMPDGAAVILNEREAWTLAQYVRIWCGEVGS